jgi:hypothetical protein
MFTSDSNEEKLKVASCFLKVLVLTATLILKNLNYISTFLSVSRLVELSVTRSIGRAMAQAVSRRGGQGSIPGQSQWGFVVDKVALRQVFPCHQFPSTCAPLHEKRGKNNHLHRRVAQEASRLRCVRSVCCGALLHKKKKKKTAYL